MAECIDQRPSREIVIPPVLAILIDAARAEQISLDDIVSSGPGHYQLRCAVAWAARKSCDATLEQIGEALGGRHRKTIAYAIEQANHYRRTDFRFAHVSDFLRSRACKRAELARPSSTEGYLL